MRFTDWAPPPLQTMADGTATQEEVGGITAGVGDGQILDAVDQTIMVVAMETEVMEIEGKGSIN